MFLLFLFKKVGSEKSIKSDSKSTGVMSGDLAGQGVLLFVFVAMVSTSYCPI